jgi:hypothetical protein
MQRIFEANAEFKGALENLDSQLWRASDFTSYITSLYIASMTRLRKVGFTPLPSASNSLRFENS